ncbi:MAG: sulfatase-like hydrolase/transferase, partial [Spirochaetes bacterium]|nr:sulfatase-like hydrolase/transferase [Spirochaetota bacterium]
MKNIRILGEKISYFLTERQAYAFRFSTAFFISLIALGLVYRLRILLMIYTDSAFTISTRPLALFFHGMCNESLFSLLFALAVFLFVAPFLSFIQHRTIKSAIFAKGILILLLFAFLYNTSYHFWVSMNTGFTRDLLFEALATTRMDEAVHFLTFADALFFIIPIVIYLFVIFRQQFPKWQLRIVCTFAIFFMAIHNIISIIHSDQIENSIVQPPAQYTFLSFFEKDNWNTTETFSNLTSSSDQMKSIALIDPRFVNHRIKPTSAPLLARSKEQWNVLIIIMESIGKQYIFDTSKGNPLPMPFFKQLSEKGLYFDFHYSTGNTSPRSIFSLLSGLYPSPRVQMFCTKPDVVVPSIKTYLGESYDAFFVTPGSLDWFFPKGFLKNSGFKEIYGYKEIPARVVKDTYGKNDIDAVTFFLQRLEKSKNRPFVAIYYSFAAHWPYV